MSCVGLVIIIGGRRSKAERQGAIDGCVESVFVRVIHVKAGRAVVCEVALQRISMSLRITLAFTSVVLAQQPAPIVADRK